MPGHASSRSAQVGGAPSTLGTVAPGPTAVGFGVMVVAVVVGFGVSSTRARSKVVVAWQGASQRGVLKSSGFPGLLVAAG